jgi:hypothetical protein
MKSNSLNSKMPMTLGGILIVIAVGYYFYSSGGQPAPDATVSFSSIVGPTATSSVGFDIIDLLKKVNQLRINTKFFDSTVVQSLIDFSQPIPAENVGRPNPFLPIAGGSAAPSGSGLTGATSTSTRKTK